MIKNRTRLVWQGNEFPINEHITEEPVFSNERFHRKYLEMHFSQTIKKLTNFYNLESLDIIRQKI